MIDNLEEHSHREKTKQAGEKKLKTKSLFIVVLYWCLISGKHLFSFVAPPDNCGRHPSSRSDQARPSDLRSRTAERTRCRSDECSPLTLSHSQQTVLMRPLQLCTFMSFPFSKRLSGSDFISQWQYCGGPGELSLVFPPAFLLAPVASFAEDTVSPSSPLPVLLRQ